MSRPYITFLMIAYNTEQYIEQCVGSILGQTEKNINVFVRNNGSTDRTGEILQRLAHADPRLHVVENAKNWHDDAGNYFIKDGLVAIWPIPQGELLGEYITIVDSDDWLDPTFAEKTYRCASQNQPDIVACGANFNCNGKVIGVRMPPNVVFADLAKDRNPVKKNFGFFYNAFRVWWGKLFRSDFFLKEYDFAWRSINARQFLDTAMMLRYLQKCAGFASVCEPLYQFRQRDDSTYVSTRAPDSERILEAEHLWIASRETLSVFDAATQENLDFLCALNWAYIKEYLPGFRAAGDVPTDRQLGWLAATFNSPILSHYIRGTEKEVAETAMEYTQIICEREPTQYAKYASYLVRLRYFLMLYGQDSENRILPALLVGCLSDPVNVNHLGLSMLSALKAKTLGLRGLEANLTFYTVAKSSFNAWADDYARRDDSDEVKALESLLDQRAEAEKYDDVCEIIEQISRLSPLNYCAMYYRIQMAILVDEWELVAALCHTSRILWPNDAPIQALCWNVMKDLD